MTRVLTPCGHLWRALLPYSGPIARETLRQGATRQAAIKARVRGASKGAVAQVTRVLTPCGASMASATTLFGSNRGGDPSARDTYGLRGRPALRDPAQAFYGFSTNASGRQQCVSWKIRPWAQCQY